MHFIVEGRAKLPPTWVRVRHDNMTVSPPELGILPGVGLPDREPSLTRFGLVGLVSKAVPALPAISYGGIGMIAITDTILQRAHGGKSRLGAISLRVSFRGIGTMALSRHRQYVESEISIEVPERENQTCKGINWFGPISILRA